MTERKDRFLIIGPPGTGKTTTLLRYLERELGRAPAKEIAFVSFTRSARMEAKRRAAKAFACNPEDLVWFRTIHSTAFKLLGLRGRDLMTAKDWGNFVDKYGYDLSAMHLVKEDDDDFEFNLNTTTEDDLLISTYDWGRNRCLDLNETIRRAPFRIDERRLRTFVHRYKAMKNETRKHDFHDLLEKSLVSNLQPPVRVAFIDEAQDLSPLQVKLVERWFWTCDRVYVAGDDDQAIFSFMGGDPTWMLKLSKEFRVQTLEKSFRVPGKIHSMAMQSLRHNKMRVQKIYRAKEEPGQVDIVDRKRAIEMIREDEDTFVLARNWRVLRRFAKLMRGTGIAFIVERFANWSPMGTGHGLVLRAWRSTLRLQEGQRIQARDFDSVLAYVGKTDLLPRGTKARAKDNKAPLDIEALASDWALPDLAQAFRDRGTDVLTKIKPELHRELDAIMRRYGQLPDPKVTLTSMHSSKGREADTVILIPDMTRSTYHALTRGDQPEFEGENRLAYVALTRSKNRLIVCAPESPKYYPYLELAKHAYVPERTADDWNFGD